MGKINLLDCTLRDGGYINDWNFGRYTIEQIVLKLAQTGIEMIELGFLKGNSYNPDKSLFPDTDSFANVIKQKSPEISYVGMLDMSAPVPLERIKKRNPCSIDGIRVIFKQNKINEAYSVCSHIKDMGYDLFVNFVNTDCYTDKEFIDGIVKYNKLSPKGMTIVDTFGMIKKKHFLRLAAIADHNMERDIMLCYHAHNNLQQAFANAEALIDMNLSRDVVIDACVFGMGRGAGNLNLELLAEYMNENYGTSYRITPMLEIMDEYLTEFYRKKFWGYSLPLYLSATAGCHPNYAIYLAEKNTLTEKAFSELLETIPDSDKIIFSKDKAEYYYDQYLQNYVDDKECINKLSDIFRGRKVLLIGPGKSLEEYKSKIQEKIKEDNLLTLSVNFFDTKINPDYTFVSNMRRYRQLSEEETNGVIVTSNIKSLKETDYVINLSSYTVANEIIHDNAGVMALRLLAALGTDKVYIVGMDGYNASSSGNYFKEQYEIDRHNNYSMMNTLIRGEISEIKKFMNIEFLTPSKYEVID